MFVVVDILLPPKREVDPSLSQLYVPPSPSVSLSLFLSLSMCVCVCVCVCLCGLRMCWCCWSSHRRVSGGGVHRDDPAAETCRHPPPATRVTLDLAVVLQGSVDQEPGRPRLRELQRYGEVYVRVRASQ